MSIYPQLKVEARLVDIEEDEVEIGLPVELTVVPDINGALGRDACLQADGKGCMTA